MLIVDLRNIKSSAMPCKHNFKIILNNEEVLIVSNADHNLGAQKSTSYNGNDDRIFFTDENLNYHRYNGPAIINKTINIHLYYANGVSHRIDGYPIELFNEFETSFDEHKVYNIHGFSLQQDSYEKILEHYMEFMWLVSFDLI